MLDTFLKRARRVLLAGGLLLLVAGAGCDSSAVGGDDGGMRLDGGMRPDGGIEADGETPADGDAGTQPDHDGGPQPGDDGGAPSDGPVNDAAFLSQDVPTTVAVGESFAVEIVMENTGTTTWSRESGYYLGSENPRDNFTWGTNRVYLDAQASVPPGEQYAFPGTLTTPAQAGTYDFQWQMLQDAVEWFGQPTANVRIEVVDACEDHCSNGRRDCGETDVDCGGSCEPCPAVEIWSGAGAYPSVAATDGRVIAVWGNSGDQNRLYYTCRDESGWSTPERVPDLSHNSDFGRLETDSQGRVHLIVHAGLGDNRAAMYSMYSGTACSGGWSAPVQVDDDQANSCWVQIAIDENDEPHAAWTDRGYHEIHYSRSISGTWSDPTVVIDTAHNSCHGDITVDGTTAHLVWQEGTSPRLPAWSYWTGSEFSEPYELSNQFHNWPQIVADTSGDLHVLYTRRHGDHEVKYRKRSGGTWEDEVTIGIGGDSWTWTSLAVDPDDILHAVWTQTDATYQSYYCLGDASTGGWETPRRVSTDDTRYHKGMTLSVDPMGRTHVVWKQSEAADDETGKIYYRTFVWGDLSP